MRGTVEVRGNKYEEMRGIIAEMAVTTDDAIVNMVSFSLTHTHTHTHIHTRNERDYRSSEGIHTMRWCGFE